MLCGAETSLEEGDFLDAVLSEEDAELLPLEERAERRPRDDGLNASTPGPDGSWHPGRIRGELVCKDWDAYYNDTGVELAAVVGLGGRVELIVSFFVLCI